MVTAKQIDRLKPVYYLET